MSVARPSSVSRCELCRNRRAFHPSDYEPYAVSIQSSAPQPVLAHTLNVAFGSVASILRRLLWVRFTSDCRQRPRYDGLQFSASIEIHVTDSARSYLLTSAW